MVAPCHRKGTGEERNRKVLEALEKTVCYPSMRWVFCRQFLAGGNIMTTFKRGGSSGSINFQTDAAKAFYKKAGQQERRQRGPEGCDTFLDLQ